MAGLVMLACGVCKEDTIHKLNACIHCGAIYSAPYMVLDPEARYRRLLSIETGGADTRSRMDRAARRGRGITIRSKTAGNGNPAS